MHDQLQNARPFPASLLPFFIDSFSTTTTIAPPNSPFALPLAMVHSLSFLTPFFLAASTLAASVQKPDLALPSYADAVKAEVADIFNASYNAYKQAPFLSILQEFSVNL